MTSKEYRRIHTEIREYAQKPHADVSIFPGKFEIPRMNPFGVDDRSLFIYDRKTGNVTGLKYLLEITGKTPEERNAKEGILVKLLQGAETKGIIENAEKRKLREKKEREAAEAAAKQAVQPVQLIQEVKPAN
jgi:hypothetical protein